MSRKGGSPSPECRSGADFVLEMTAEKYEAATPLPARKYVAQSKTHSKLLISFPCLSSSPPNLATRPSKPYPIPKQPPAPIDTAPGPYESAIAPHTAALAYSARMAEEASILIWDDERWRVRARGELHKGNVETPVR